MLNEYNMFVLYSRVYYMECYKWILKSTRYVINIKKAVMIKQEYNESLLYYDYNLDFGDYSWSKDDNY